MGMDFVALMRYGGLDERVLHALDSLEEGSPDELRAVKRLMKQRDFAVSRAEVACWRTSPDSRLAHRPDLPDLTAALRTPEDFFLTFDSDAFEVYHLLRWRFFLTDSPLQRAMLDACTCLGHLFRATDCIITSDFNPVVHAFRDGKSFDEALAAAGPEDGERRSLAELYQEGEDSDIIAHVAGGGPLARLKQWDKSKPVPQGWQRMGTWDSKGYWRFKLAPPE